MDLDKPMRCDRCKSLNVGVVGKRYLYSGKMKYCFRCYDCKFLAIIEADGWLNNGKKEAENSDTKNKFVD